MTTDKTVRGHDLYASETGSYIEDLKLTKVENDWMDGVRRVWFTWRGQDQWLEMTREEDGYWLISETEYTDEFDELISSDGFLDDYDSLESTFSLDDLIPSVQTLTFEA